VKTIRIEQATLDSCVAEAQGQRVVVTRAGRPVALIVGIEGLDEEQIRRGADPAFWELIAERRGQRALSRVDLERAVEGPD